ERLERIDPSREVRSRDGRATARIGVLGDEELVVHDDEPRALDDRDHLRVTNAAVRDAGRLRVEGRLDLGVPSAGEHAGQLVFFVTFLGHRETRRECRDVVDSVAVRLAVSPAAARARDACDFLFPATRRAAHADLAGAAPTEKDGAFAGPLL